MKKEGIMKSVTVSAKNIEKAIEEGLQQLNTTFENVDITVISEGGFLKKAVVELTLNEEEKPAKAPKETPKEAKKAELKPERAKPAPVVEEITEEETEMLEQLLTIEKELQQLETQAPEQKVNTNEVVVEEIKKFLNGLLYAYNIIATVEVELKDREFFATIVGENLGVLIGYHGEALEAIQFVLSNYVANKTGRMQRIVLDIENYRQKRADALKTMATNLVARVLETKRSFKLEPMNSFERKVIHTHLQDMEHIDTHSEGQEPHRYLVIDYVA